MKRFRVTDPARREIQDIGRYTEEHWGIRQRDRFLRELNEKLRWLAENPGTGRNRNEIEAGLKCYPHGAYMIFYFAGPDGVQIVGIKHSARDEAKWWRD